MCTMNHDTYTHTTARSDIGDVKNPYWRGDFRYDPVNLDRYIPLWRRIWWRLSGLSIRSKREMASQAVTCADLSGIY